ncbi:TRAP transporter small permease subunit [Thalassolituus marinus]|jgi:TRAP-type mannitol/chloroaromatic compound transport system permease small subunit|uniref:TRAP transporter small permease protein n=1 Tax=Thalassolituus marinus TaxID=671053 RepID=A0ABS7ZXV8_9GAMM|nr:TRAP transporter small permease subunit [Thalassolituus marinus]MCA6065210.1 TRAP transporter small permease subunit [Thalassolituus marinus]
MLIKAEKAINRFSDFLGTVSAVLFLLMLANVFIDVVMRYVFNDVSIAMQELEWHFFAAMFMLGVPYTLRTGGHVRVDLVYERLSAHKQSVIDIGGGVLLLLPFCLLVGWYGIDFAHEAFALGEMSGDPGGLPQRWIIKAVIPFAFFSTAIAGVAMILSSIITYRENTLHKTDRGLL